MLRCGVPAEEGSAHRSTRHQARLRQEADEFFLKHSDIPPKGTVPHRKHYNPAGGWGGAVPDAYLPLVQKLFDDEPSLFLTLLRLPQK